MSSADPIDFSKVGTIRDLRVLDDGGSEYRGVRGDGSKVPDGVKAGRNGALIRLALSGRIDMAKLHEGDVVTVPYSMSGHYANPGMLLDYMAGPTALRDTSGNILFDVFWIPSRGSGVLLSLKRTGVASTGEYSFNLTSASLALWIDLDPGRMAMDSTSITVAGSTVSFDNTPFSDDDLNMIPCNTGVYATSSVSGSYMDGVDLSFQQSGCADLNRMLRGGDADTVTDDIIILETITPTSGSIRDVTYKTTRVGWPKAYDATTIGANGYGLYGNLTWFKDLFTHGDDTAITLEAAKRLLKPGQWATHDNGDGSWTTAVNLGARRGAHAILPPDGWTTGDTVTDGQIGKARKALMSPVSVETFLRVTVNDPDKPFAANGQVTALVDGRETHSTIAMNNTTGSTAGQGQSTIRFDGNGAKGAMADMYGDPDSTATVANMFTRDGYTFTGWNTKPDGMGDMIPDGGTATYPKENTTLTLYAQWKADKAPITYNANADTATGTMTPTDGVTDGRATVAANGFAYTHHVFTGWNTKPDGSGDTFQPGDTVTLPAGGLTLYAQWSPLLAMMPAAGTTAVFAAPIAAATLIGGAILIRRRRRG